MNDNQKRTLITFVLIFAAVYMFMSDSVCIFSLCTSNPFMNSIVLTGVIFVISWIIMSKKIF